MQAQVALSKDFLEAFSSLPETQQKKTREFLTKFRENPTQPGMHLEPIETAVDPKVRSVRLDQVYRIIMIQPPRGDVFLCVWVDRHDDAYSWVRRRRFDVNPMSGVFQVYETVDAPAPGPDVTHQVPTGGRRSGGKPTTGLLSDHTDEDILLAGVPAALLPAVRDLCTEEDLDRLAPRLPADAAEMLYRLAAGYTVTEAWEEAALTQPPAPVEPDDFERALGLAGSQRTFRLLQSDLDLEEILNAPLEQWRVFLHPTQRALVQVKASGPVRVLGGAGTGKTVALLHRAVWLASKVFTDRDDRILVTTFTHNLAIDLRTQLRKISGNAFERIEVMNLHDWALRFLRRHGFAWNMIKDEDRRQLFQEAVAAEGVDDYPAAFYLDEWDRVVQEQNVDSLDAYFTARRVGRGLRLDRKARAAVWPVFARYRALLQESGMNEWPDMIREALGLFRSQKTISPYRAVLADEVQDFAPNELRLLRALAPEGPDSLFLVGDGHQRIYGHKTTLGACGIEIRGRSRRLRLNYRTTQEIRKRAVSILEGCAIDDLDGEPDNMRGFVSLRSGPAPRILHFDSEAREREAVIAILKEWLKTVPDQAICLGARTHALLRGRYQQMVKDAEIPAVVVGTDPEAEARRPGIRLATLHRMKGLEFRCVLLAGIQEGTMPLTPEDASDADEASRQDREMGERCLLYVGASRARDELVIVGYGRPSPILPA
jgi:superfamily I DNA/RNA helicase